MLSDFNKLYQRELQKLKSEISSFKEETNLWKVTGSVTNTAGNLCLHLCGNLNTFIGQQLGNTGYVRDRPFEFGGKNVPREELLRQIEEVSIVIEQTLNNMSDDELEEVYPLEFLGYEMTKGYCLTHLFGHFSYHLGQINYLRRILE